MTNVDQESPLRWLWQLVIKIILILCRCQRRPTQIVALFQSFPTSWALVSLMRWQQIVLIKLWNQQIHFFMKLLFTSKASWFDCFRFQWKRWSRFLGKCTTAQKPRRFSSQGGFLFLVIIMIMVFCWIKSEWSMINDHGSGRCHQTDWWLLIRRRRRSPGDDPR